ncbi:MAG: Trk system potassium transporter TrkA [Acidimicrobiia bacterium]
MRIIVVGAGAVGSYLAERFSSEKQDVVVIESNPKRAAEMQNDLDCLVISANGASAATIAQAGGAETDLLIAVSSSDAVNVLACHAAHELGIERKIARIEDAELKAEVEALGVNLVIDPGEAAAEELVKLVTTGPVAEHVEFADGQLLLVGTYLHGNSSAIGKTLAEIRQDVKTFDWLVVAVVRRDETFIARGDTRLEEGDHVLLMAKADHTEEPYRVFALAESGADRVIILGATRLAELAAKRFVELPRRRFQAPLRTYLIDADPVKTRAIAERLPDVIVETGNPTDPDFLRDVIKIGAGDAVLALTGWDGDNLLGGLVAKALGADEAIARFNNTGYFGLLGGFGIDATVSSRISAANAILRFVRRGAIHSAVTIPGSSAEALELEVQAGSPACGRTLRELKLPKTLIVAGIQRNGDAFVPRGNTVVERGDRLIVVALPKGIPVAEQLSGT